MLVLYLHSSLTLLSLLSVACTGLLRIFGCWNAWQLRCSGSAVFGEVLWNGRFWMVEFCGRWCFPAVDFAGLGCCRFGSFRCGLIRRRGAAHLELGCSAFFSLGCSAFWALRCSVFWGWVLYVSGIQALLCCGVGLLESEHCRLSSLAVGEWFLAVGEWLLAVGDWLLAVGDYRLDHKPFWAIVTDHEPFLSKLATDWLVAVGDYRSDHEPFWAIVIDNESFWAKLATDHWPLITRRFGRNLPLITGH